MRIKFLLPAIVATPILASANIAVAATPKKPNVVLIFVDDMRYDAIAALGNDVIKTPNLDRLVKGGVTFTNTYMQGANTGGTSVPSRAQLLSGRGLFEIADGTGKEMDSSMTTLAEALSAGGYYTHIIGKSHNGPTYSMQGFQGGDRLYGLKNGYYRPHFKIPIQDFREDGKYNSNANKYLVKSLDPELREPATNYSSNKADDDFRGVHSSELFGRAAMDFIVSYDREEPYFLYLAFHAPHDTRISPPEYHNMYNPKDIKLPANFLPQHPFDNGDLSCRDELLAPHPRTESDTKQQIADYYGIISHLDHWVGEVIKSLEESGDAKNTIIVFASDSGLAVGSHGLFGKQSLYDDGGVHIPFIISGAGIPRNQRRNDLCYTYDIYPTLCDLTSSAIPSTVTGKSLKSRVLDGKSEKIRSELYLGYRTFQRAVRCDEYKLIEYCVGDERHTQLFNIAKDPRETTDLSTDAAYSAKLAQMRKKLEKNRSVEAQWGEEFWTKYDKK
ncbi:MAG: sulfatase-like hydrolase/transferase [Rikenellaceae bacterium]